MGSPVLWGPNNYANNLQNAELTATGALLAYNGPKNYITYGNFENQLTTGWSLGTIGTLTNGLPTGSPTFGSGASGNLSIAIVTSNQLAGTASLSYVSSAATTAGNMLASQAYTIDVEDQAKVLGFKFSYSAISNASNANWSGTSSNSFGVAVYDVTNSVFLGVAGAFNIVQSSGTGIATGTFQTGATTASIRFIVYNVNATSGAITLYFDSFQVGPQVTMQAPAMDDWKTYTMTITGTTSNPTFGTQFTNVAKYRRVGDTMEITFNYNQTSAGTAGSGAYLFSLPPGFSIDTNKVNLPATLPTASILSYGGSQIGWGWFGNTSTGNVNYSGKISFFPYNSTTIAGNADTNTALQQYPVGSSLAANFSSTNFTIQIKAWVPIVGWSSNSVSSSDTDTRVISTRAYLSANQTGINTNNSYVKINLNTTNYDTNSAFSTTNNRYVCGISGFYQFNGTIIVAGTNVLNNSYSAALYKNGTISSAGALFPAANGVSLGVTVVDTISLNAGDYVELYLFGAGNNSVSTLTATSGATGATNLSASRISGPAVVTATESVNAAYGNGAGTSITSSSTVVPWPTKVFDSHSAMNVNGTYTVPVSGKYLVSATILTASTAFAVANNLQLYLYKNGSSVNTLGYNYVLGTTRAWVTGNNIVNCNAGDTIQIYMNVGSGSTTLSNATTDNFISIARVGN